MILRFSALLLLALVTACTSDTDTSGKTDRLKQIGLDNLPGHSEAILFEIYGQPTSAVQLETGHTGYLWNNTAYEFPSEYSFSKEKRKERTNESRSKSIGDTAVDTMFSRHGKAVQADCKLGVTTLNGVIVTARTQDIEKPIACDDFYTKWRRYQIAHPDLLPKSRL